MPALLNSFLPLLARVAPDLLGLVLGTGASAEDIGSVVVNLEAALTDIFGSTDPAAVQQQIDADPAKSTSLQVRLASETEKFKTRLADAQKARSLLAALPMETSPAAWGSPIVSGIVVLAFAVVSVVVFGRYGVESAVGQLIAGALIAKFGTVVDFWLGSSRGSSDRADQITAMLHQSIVAQAAAGPAVVADRGHR
jgi:hypothetical protein